MPPGQRGPTPKYCSPGHRQRAYETRRSASAAWAALGRPRVLEALKAATAMPTGFSEALKAATAMPPGLSEALKAATAMPTGLSEALKAATAMPPGLSEALKAATAMPPGLSEALKAATAMPPGLSELLARRAELWREIDPPNWPDQVSWSDMYGLVSETGWSLVHVPRPTVIIELVEAEPADRPSILLAHAEEVVADCRACLKEVSGDGTAHLVIALDQALDAFEAHLPIPAQTTVASVLADVVNRVLGLSFAAAAKELDENPDKVPMPYLRFWLVASTIPAALTRFNSGSGDEVPDCFNRHAVAHTVDPRQYTKLNALVGLMLTTGLVREIDDESTRRGVGVAEDQPACL